jgi:RNA recognition motif-containing protein
MNIFVAKLNFRTTSNVLKEKFSEYGEVSSAKVVIDHATGRSKGYGFVEMTDDYEANRAINELNNAELDGSKIVVKRANPRNERSSSQGQGQRNYRPRNSFISER